MAAVRSEPACEVRLRAVQEADEDFLLQVYASTRADELERTDWTEEQKSAFVRQQFDFQNSAYWTDAQYPGALFQLILGDNQRAGRLYTCRLQGELRIMDIALLPEYRGRGIGTYLLRRLQQQAAREYLSLGIHVEIFNRALKLYERLGFRKVEDRGVYLFLQWESSWKSS